MAFVRNHTTGTSASGTSVTATLAADAAAYNLLLVWVAMDNTGATTPTVSSIDKPAGETNNWAQFGQHDSSTATSAGGVRGELWAIKTTRLWASGTVITATLSASPPKSHMLCQEHSGVLATARGTAGTSTSTTGAVSAVTSGTALVSGDLVIGGATFETSTTPTGDADTTNGSWSTALTGNTGGGASAAQVSSVMQYKYVTAAGVQTYNPTAGSTDSGAAVVSLQPDAGAYPAVGQAALTVTANPVGFPFSIDTPGVWFDASKISGLADAAAVATWNDSSSNARNATEATNQPTYQTAEQNTLPGVLFDGTNDRLTYNGAFLVGTQMTVFAVVRATKTTASPILGGTASATNANLALFWNGASEFIFGYFANDLNVGAVTAAATGDIFTGIQTGSGRQLWQGRTSKGTDANTTLLASYAGASMGQTENGVFFGGLIFEVLIYQRALTLAERESVWDYLEAKWGLAVSTSANAGQAALAATAYDATATTIAGGEGPAQTISTAATAYDAAVRTRLNTDWSDQAQATTYNVGEGPANVQTISLAAAAFDAPAGPGASVGQAALTATAYDASTSGDSTGQASQATLAATAYDATASTTSAGTGNAGFATLAAAAQDTTVAVGASAGTIELLALAEHHSDTFGDPYGTESYSAKAAVAPQADQATLTAVAQDATATQVISPTGISSGQAVSPATTVVSGPPQTITATGISSSEVFGVSVVSIVAGGGQVTRGNTQGVDWTLNESASTAALACTLPSAMASGKFLTAHVIGGPLTATTGLTLPGTGGWAWAVNPVGGNNTVAIGLAYTTNASPGLTFGQDTATRMTVVLTVYSGVDTTTPIDVTPTTGTVTATTLNLTGVTTTLNNAMVVTGEGANSSTTSITVPTGTGLVARNTSGTGKGGAYADQSFPTAGATGTETWTIGATTTVQVAYLTALRPSAAASPQTITTTGIASIGAVGNSTVAPDQALAVVGIRSSETFGVAAVTQAALQTITAIGIPSGQTIGNPVVAISAGTLNHIITGNVTSSGFVVGVRTTSALTVRLKVSTTSDLSTSPVFGSSANPDANGYCKPTITGLSAATQYYYGVEVDGVVAGSPQGSCKTAPSGVASFSFAFASCHEETGLTADSAAWTRAKARNPDFFVECGDFGYWDITTNSPATFRSNWNSLVNFTNVAPMLRNVPFYYTWSDHDFGDNNAVGSAPSSPAANSVYRQIFPSPALDQPTTGIYHTFTYGRARFILTDNRSFKSANTDADNSSKTVLGTTQKQWFKDQITNATEPVIFWVNEHPWVGVAGTGDDEWSNYSTERTELANHIVAAGKRVIILAGDMHAVAADNGTNSVGSIPVMHGAPLHNLFSNKGGPYTSGPFPTSGASNIEQYGFVTLTDNGSKITIQFNGYDNTDTSQVSLNIQIIGVDGIPSRQSVGNAAITAAQAISATGIPSAQRVSSAATVTKEGIPETILFSSNLAGLIDAIQDDPVSADGSWLTAIDAQAATDLRVSFPTPQFGNRPKVFQAYARKTTVSGAPDPTLVMELWEAGTFKQQLVSATVTSATGQLVTGKYSPSYLTDTTGKDAELRTYTLDAIPGVGSGWTEVYRNTFEAGSNLTDWGLYDGPYGSDPFNWAKPSHVFIQDGMLHILMQYDLTGGAGAAWYTGGMQLSNTYASINQQITLRYRVVNTDFTNVRGHRNIPMHWGNEPPNWPSNGEIDYLEGSGYTDPSTFIHYGTSPPGTTDSHDYAGTGVDLSQWTTVRCERDNHVVRVYINDLVTPAFTYNGNSTSVPDNLQRVVLQQECRSTGCPPPGTDTEDIQVAWITVANK